MRLYNSEAVHVRFPRMQPVVVFRNVSWRQEYCKMYTKMWLRISTRRSHQNGLRLTWTAHSREEPCWKLETIEAKVRTVFTCKNSSREGWQDKIAMLLSAIGPEALERYNHFTWPTVCIEGDEVSKVPSKDFYEKAFSLFEQEFAGTKRVVFSRFELWEHSRAEDKVLTNTKLNSEP